MNQLAQPTVVAAVCYGPIKGPLSTAADGASAQAVGIELRVVGKHSLTANGTHFAADGMNLIQTLGTDRKPRNIQQRGCADATVGRKQNGEKALGDPAAGSSMNPASIHPDATHPALV
jgi:hypothetical protein